MIAGQWDDLVPDLDNRIQRRRSFGGFGARATRLWPSRRGCGGMFQEADVFIRPLKGVPDGISKGAGGDDAVAGWCWIGCRVSSGSFRCSLLSDRLRDLEPRAEGPRFVFLHVLAPHLPHTVDAAGNPLPEAPEYYQGFRDEVTYVKRQLLELFDSIVRSGRTRIFLSGGSRTVFGVIARREAAEAVEWTLGDEAYVRDRTAILNAYYFPGGDYDGLYPTISPVNSFRVFLNAYFGAGLPLLDDVSFVLNQDDDALIRVERPRD